MHIARNEDAPQYTKPARARRASAAPMSADDKTILKAMEILRQRLTVATNTMDSPQAMGKFLVLHAGAPGRDPHREYFTVVYLDSQHRVITVADEFVGTLTQTSVYPREVVRSALTHNAAAVVLSHNHPSGATQPSRADETLTQTLKTALSLVDVRVLDHIITAGAAFTSMAELGLV